MLNLDKLRAEIEALTEFERKHDHASMTIYDRDILQIARASRRGLEGALAVFHELELCAPDYKLIISKLDELNTMLKRQETNLPS